jgi:hypothetical protein
MLLSNSSTHLPAVSTSIRLHCSCPTALIIVHAILGSFGLTMVDMSERNTMPGDIHSEYYWTVGDVSHQSPGRMSRSLKKGMDV